MRKGFIFNHNRCVTCNACNAACILENGWNVHPRNIFTYNSDAVSILPVINLSLACNHCESAICMEGCPTSALYRNEITGAIIVDEKKCIGCKYCMWNCPYDAPKFDSESKTIVKCNLCFSESITGNQPACSTSCPTGALSYGTLTESASSSAFTWFPDKKLNPAIEFTGKKNENPLRIVPSGSFEPNESNPDPEKKTILTEISLIIFSFLSTFSVATIISSFIDGKFPDNVIFITVLILAGLASLFHLGRKVRSWRSISNFRTSPLSREIILFITYVILSLLTTFLRIPFLVIISSLTGLVFLAAIDSVYIFSDKRKSVFLHSGQTFISALLMISFFSGLTLPFIFIALIKLISSIYNLVNNPSRNLFNIRFMRIALLIITAMSMILNSLPDNFSIIIIFMVGELLDRILFYIDFNPLNINSLIHKQINHDRDEKKRS
jgi:Fe-S-cluster-containing dehydrogenase component/DMSO reductase anchor subunit